MSLEDKLQDLLQRKLIRPEKIRDDQIIKLLERAQKDLKGAKVNLEIDEEIAYNYAYLTMLRTARALMFAFDYRPIDGSQHWTVVEFAKRVLGTEPQKIVEHFDEMRRTRNQITYDPDIPVSESEARDAIGFAKEFIKFAAAEIAKRKPNLQIKAIPGEEV